MHLSLAIIAAGLLRILPSCSASPMAAVASPAKAPAEQRTGTTSGPCSNPAASGTSADCWTSLGMDAFLANWTQATVIAGAPMIGTIVCRPTEGWAQCFIRFAYGLQRQTTAPMDCESLSSTSCSPPSQQMLKPTFPEYWYGVQAIYCKPTQQLLPTLKPHTDSYKQLSSSISKPSPQPFSPQPAPPALWKHSTPPRSSASAPPERPTPSTPSSSHSSSSTVSPTKIRPSTHT